MMLKKKKKVFKYRNKKSNITREKKKKRSKPKKGAILKVFAKLYLPKQNHIHRIHTTQRNKRKRLKYTLV